MLALVVLILGFFAITAIFAYYLMVAILIAIGVAFMTVVSISFFVGSELHPLAGIATFLVLGSAFTYAMKKSFNTPEEVRPR